nr:EOG090X0FIE [Triops cancriformis]
MWYPEEICKVLVNLKNKVGFTYYGYPQISEQGTRRHGSTRTMSGHQMVITPSRWQYTKFKDYLHFYIMLGIIPCTLISFFVNVFVGPAELTEIPEGYVPKHWEYERHPITRWMARYVFPSPQQSYEITLHAAYEVEFKRQLRLLERQVHEKMAARGDYQSYYYLPVSARYHELVREESEIMLAHANEKAI